VSAASHAPQPPHAAPETRHVTARRICCDGGEGALGHPRIWLTIPDTGWIDCPYCDARFVLDGDGGDH
jgi:uncharacterized Zn-finger protein